MYENEYCGVVASLVVSNERSAREEHDVRIIVDRRNAGAQLQDAPPGKRRRIDMNAMPSLAFASQVSDDLFSWESLQLAAGL